MAKVELPGIGLQGLNTDVPPHALPIGFFPVGEHLRPFDGSLQGVPVFDDDADFVWTSTSGTDTTADGIYNTVQVTPTGSDFYNILSIVNNASDNVIRAIVINENLPAIRPVVDLPVDEPVIFNEEFGLDLISFNETTILNAGTHQPLYFTQGIETNGDFAVIPNWFPPSDGVKVYAKHMSIFNGRLVAMNFTGGNRGAATVAFSDPIDRFDSLTAVEWQIAATNTAGDDIAAGTPGIALGGTTLGNRFILYKSDSIIAYDETTGSPFFIPTPIFFDDGALSPRSFVEISGARHLVVGNRGIYVHDGTVNNVNISRGRIEDQVFTNEIDFSKKDRAFCFYDKVDKEVWCCFADMTQTLTGCNVAYVYNTISESWYKRSVPNLQRMVATTINGREEIFGASLESAVLLQLNRTSYVADGFIELQRNSIGDATLTKLVKAIYPMSNGNIKVGLEPTDSLTEPYIFTDDDLEIFDPSEGYKVDFREEGRYFDLRFQMDGTTNPEMSSAQADINPKGRR